MISFVDGYFGWLGNQLFQAAATCALALKHASKRTTSVAEWYFPRNKPDLHKIFSLSATPGPPMYATPKALDSYRRQPMTPYREPHFHHDPAFWDLPDGTELSGYFQSEKYFAPYAEQIRREFTFRQTWIWERPLREHVSIHVRRGDYLSFPEHHPPLTMEYYREAMSRFPGARFLVFSDDPGWCLLNFRDAGYPVQISTGRTAAEDMALMASCDHHIIANSSFSWWGSYLGRNPGKKIIAPKIWFGPAKAGWSTVDLIPESWERI